MAKRTYQKVLFWGEDATLRKTKFDIDVGRIIDDKTSRAWHHLDRFLITFPQLRCTMALISPRTEIPLSPFNKLTPKEEKKIRDVSVIAEDNLERQGEGAEREARRNRTAEMLKIALIGVVVLFIMVGVMAMYPKSGMSSIFGG